MPKDSGEIVRSVVPDGPGARGGLQQGDVIVRVNGQPVTPDQTVSYLVANTPVGSRVPLEIIRGGKRATVTVMVGERPTEEALAQVRAAATIAGQRHAVRRAVAPQRALGPVAGAADPRARARRQPARRPRTA